jgi:YaiO family outer membrane protein
MCVQRRSIGAALLLALALAGPALAEDEGIIAEARRVAAAGHRPDAIAMLEAHLAQTSRDVDARLVYGLMLSWEGQYDQARRELQQVIVQAPGYLDARVALMNVEWWSGNRREARDGADAILATDPGNPQARTMRERLAAAGRPWSASVSYANDSFNDGRQPWHESTLSMTRSTPVGSVIGRLSQANRFGYQDQQAEVEFYPRIRPGTYGFIGVGAAPGPSLYPSHRFAFDLYQSLGNGVEVSGGLRRLDFASAVMIYVGTATKYVGNWMVTGKVFHVPDEGDLDSTSYHASVRRYIRGDGTSYLGATLSRGLSREEVRSVADLTTLHSTTVRAEADQMVGKVLRLFVVGGSSRQERANRNPLWQTSFSTGMAVQF